MALPFATKQIRVVWELSGRQGTNLVWVVRQDLSDR